MKPREIENPGRPADFWRKHLLLCDGVLLLVLSLYSYAVRWMMPEYLAGLPKEVGFSPLTQMVLNHPYAIHLPLLLMMGLTGLNLFGRLTEAKQWTSCVVVCFVVFVLVSVFWLLGTTNPHWRIQ
jgi:hypothetical protein